MQEQTQTHPDQTTAGVHAGIPNGAAKHKNPWLVGIAGLAIGIAAGLGIGLSINSSSTVESSTDSTSVAITNAVQNCEFTDSAGVMVMDEGKSVELQTRGKETAGAPYSEIVCVLDGLDMPESVKARMSTTRSLDGRQETTWSGYSASWSYHPDNGLNIIVESQEQP
ncbi:hypothetical protein [Paeniglutamicibacter terrestris]|uniref:DUF4307 domain-containing protein n=1 Tax=Paeniglutamicibacter terrestris TaxID=2723403 RepID=A0ABX1G6V8_9MICC|nr:hypothetical protein [Paeniglutamicibacter terrestris]NKG22000.1 hypothetical protein [Paeniglutamicibacter terrestris]